MVYFAVLTFLCFNGELHATVLFRQSKVPICYPFLLISDFILKKKGMKCLYACFSWKSVLVDVIAAES